MESLVGAKRMATNRRLFKEALKRGEDAFQKEDLQAVAESAKALYDNRHNIPAAKIVYGKELPLRHFKARFEFGEIKNSKLEISEKIQKG